MDEQTKTTDVPQFSTAALNRLIVALEKFKAQKEARAREARRLEMIFGEGSNAEPFDLNMSIGVGSSK